MILDDDLLLAIVWHDATGIRLSQRRDVGRLVEFSWALADAALGGRSRSMDSSTLGLIRLSESLTDLSLDVIDDVWSDNAVITTPIRRQVHRYVFHLGLIARPDRTGVSELEAPSPHELEWLWHRGVGSDLPGTGSALGRFINAMLIRARHEFLAHDKRLEDWELLEALDGDLFDTVAIWDATDGLATVDPRAATMFRRVVAWYLSPRLEGGVLTLGPRDVG